MAAPPGRSYSPICQLIPHTRYFRAKIRQICRRMPFLPNNWPPTVKIGTMRAEVCRISIFCQHARSGFSTLKGFSTKLSTLCTNAYFILIISILQRVDTSAFRMHYHLHSDYTGASFCTCGRASNAQRESVFPVRTTEVPLPHCRKTRVVAHEMCLHITKVKRCVVCRQVHTVV